MNECQLILCIISKLGPKYSMFVFSFHATKLEMGYAWMMPPIDDFVYTLTCKKYKSVQMGVLKSSKSHELVENESSSNKFKQKFKGRKDLYSEKD